MRALSCFILSVLCASRSFPQNTGFLHISTGVQVQFIVTDPHGRRTGEDPRGVSNPMQGTELREIPGARYSLSSVGDSPSADYQPSPQDLQFEFEYRFRSPDDDGIYTVETIGTTLGPYTLFVDVSPRRGSTLQRYRKEIKGVTNINQVTKYQLTYSGIAGAPVALEKIVTANTLRQDLENCYKLKLLGDKGFHEELSNILDSYEKHLSRKDALKAVKELEKFHDRITKEYKEGTKSRDKRFVTADALQILSYDVQYLTDRLHHKSKHGRGDDEKDKKPKK